MLNEMLGLLPARRPMSPVGERSRLAMDRADNEDATTEAERSARDDVGDVVVVVAAAAVVVPDVVALAVPARPLQDSYHCLLLHENTPSFV
jgi:hypothetical protein